MITKFKLIFGYSAHTRWPRMAHDVLQSKCLHDVRTEVTIEWWNVCYLVRLTFHEESGRYKLQSSNAPVAPSMASVGVFRAHH